jgi:hypothetical protein
MFILIILDKRIRLNSVAYKKVAKEKLEKTDNLLRKINSVV